MVKAYVRFIGNKVCFTLVDGTERFYMAEKEECSDQELEICENGGGECEISALRMLAFVDWDFPE